MSSPPADPLLGSTISQYSIVAKLGGGGMGVVYKATDTKLGRAVALKFLPPQWSHDEGAKQRFLREAQAASATNHRNICVIHDIEHTDDGRLFIVMAYYDGQTLKQKLEGGALPLVEALEIASEIAEGLAKAHAQGVVHRDIKPGNVMVTDDGVKLLDFGLAKFADALQLTIPGTTVGTVAYMSPEQARGEEADARSDVWALGVVLYQMLTGEVPFKGSYEEAVFYAIKNEPVPPLRTAGGEIPEALETIVMRALAKDPETRYQSARELARDLRVLQGRTVPVDLLTAPVSLVGSPALRLGRRSRKRTALAWAAIVVTMAVGMSLWLAWPVARIPVVIVPVMNQTGFAELDPYRLALTQALVMDLDASRSVRVTPYERMLQILRRFLVDGTDASSREALQALATVSSAPFVVVPTLVYEDSTNTWRARAEIRNAETATNVAVYMTDPVVSSLKKDTAYGLMPSLAQRIDDHFRAVGPRRAVVLSAIRGFARNRSSPAAPRFRTLEAAQAFEEGTNAYEQLEYESARRAFERAAQLDPRSPLAFGWLSRVAQIVRLDDAALEAGNQAARLVTPQTPADDQLFVAAVSAEAQRDFAKAGTRYRDLLSDHPDNPAWLLELASFQDRRVGAADAIVSYRQALAKDSKLARPHLELCRLYNRLDESASAKQEGQSALEAYRALRNRGGEAQALMCLTDRLRLGRAEERVEARRDADEALRIVQDLMYPYNLARAQYYVALAAEMQGRPAEAIASYERAIGTSREAGNIVLQPLILMNLGAMSEQLGRHSQALDYYRQSYERFEALGNEQRAAQNRANAGVILVEYSVTPEVGLREIQNAAGVFRKLDDKHFEVFAAKVTAAFYRSTGRHTDAERELTRALAVARERDLRDNIAALTADLGRSQFDRGDYPSARERLLQALGDGLSKDSTQTRIHLGRAHVRLGDLATAQRDFDQAAREVREHGENGLVPLMHLGIGELAYESRNLVEARAHFNDAAALWTDALPDPASVEALSWLGFLDALDGRLEQGVSKIQKSLDQASRTKQFSIEARCRVFLARSRIKHRRFDEAVATLAEIPPDDDRTLGPELQAQAHYWRSVALAARGDRAGAESEEEIARKLAEELRRSLPEPFRASFAQRQDIRVIR